MLIIQRRLKSKFFNSLSTYCCKFDWKTFKIRKRFRCKFFILFLLYTERQLKTRFFLFSFCNICYWCMLKIQRKLKGWFFVLFYFIFICFFIVALTDRHLKYKIKTEIPHSLFILPLFYDIYYWQTIKIKK